MERRVAIKIRMELLSDAIFGSGFSVPGGEDITVCKDERGYPYMKGSTFKGLFRESLENLLAWTGSDVPPDELLGRSGRNEGLSDGRRMRFTALTAEAPPDAPEDCYNLRMFTSLKEGIAEQGTLRSAVCIARGMTFTGEMVCAERDAGLVRDAARGVKWVGTLRNRGFGRVRIAAVQAAEPVVERDIGPAACLHYRLYTELPVLITDLSRSDENNYETRGYIPGSAVRGAVMSRLAEERADWFLAHKAALLGSCTRFLNAMPRAGQRCVFPAVKGFYGGADGEKLNFFPRSGTVEPGQKRAKTGTFCLPEGNSLISWSGITGGSVRIDRKKMEDDSKKIFNTRYLEAGQELDGYIRLDDPSLAPEVAKAIGSTLWLGADKFAGFGKCRVTLLEAASETAEEKFFAAHAERSLYLLAQSPMTMLNELGEPCGVDDKRLATLLGVQTVRIVRCSTSVSDYDSFNRTWGCRAGTVRMYDAGSVFLMELDPPPEPERLRRVERSGLGIRTAEGYGQVLFFDKAVFDRIESAEYAAHDAPADARKRSVAIRRARIRWIEEHAWTVSGTGISPSQLGTVQSLCEKAIAAGGNTEELVRLFEKNITERDARTADRFKKLRALTDGVLNRPLGQTLEADCTDSITERLQLLCALFDFVRKVKVREEDNGYDRDL